jgi:hypothetical protein
MVMTLVIAPKLLRPAAARIGDSTLRTFPSEIPVTFPAPGGWLNLALTVWADNEELEHKLSGIAIRFGPLTEAGNTAAGEPVRLWLQLIDELKELSQAWDLNTGALADPIGTARARTAGKQIQERLLREHQANGGGFEVGAGGQWFLCCQNMGQWWRLSAIGDLYGGHAMRRCRHCRVWFSLAGLRADAGFCSPAHRSAFHQHRPPPSFIWAEML